MAEDFVNPEEINKDSLRALYEAAYMNVSIDSDGDIMIQDSYKAWAFVEADGKRIRLMSLFRPNPSASMPDKLAFVNRINDELIVIRAYVNKRESFGFDYYIPIEGGTSKRNIVLATKLFMGLLEAVVSKDEANVMA